MPFTLNHFFSPPAPATGPQSQKELGPLAQRYLGSMWVSPSSRFCPSNAARIEKQTTLSCEGTPHSPTCSDYKTFSMLVSAWIAGKSVVRALTFSSHPPSSLCSAKGSQPSLHFCKAQMGRGVCVSLTYPHSHKSGTQLELAWQGCPANFWSGCPSISREIPKIH